MSQSPALPDSLTELSFSEQLTLWSLRYWADSYRKEQSPYMVMKDAYRLAKAPGGLTALDNFMTLLISGNSRTVDIRCLCCRGISADEWRILQSLALTQEKNPYAAAPLISLFLEPAATRMALPVLKEWARKLFAGNHILPVREDALAVARTHYASAEMYQKQQERGFDRERPAVH